MSRSTVHINSFIDTESEKIHMYFDEYRDNEDMHDHDFFELAYITSGRVYHDIENCERKELGKGDYFIVDIGTWHKYSNAGNSGYTVINCLFLPEFIDRSLKGYTDFGDVVKTYYMKFYKRTLTSGLSNHIFHDEDGTVLKLILNIADEEKSGLPGCYEIIRCNMREIMIRTMRKVSDEREVLHNDRDIMYIEDYIAQHLDEQLFLSYFCDTLHFSLPYLSKKFKTATGMSFRDYLIRTRIDRSCLLLRNTDIKISDISREIGYKDIKFFNEVFKRNVDMTPGEFRKKYHEK